MAINFVNVAPRHERRLRLLFDNQPTGAAYGSSSTTIAYFTIAPQNFLSSIETVTQALVVAGAPNVVELALGADLAPGGTYLVTINAMPCIDASFCNGSMLFTFGAAPDRPNLEVPQDDYASLLYGIDLVHNGVDWVEGADGDLSTLAGIGNAQEAVRRRAFGDPLPWAPNYGAKARQYVDGTPGAMPGLKAQLVANLILDDRVKSVTAALSFDANDSTVAYYDVLATLIGNEVIGPMPVNVTA
jgi:hypothetical protein